MSGHPNDAQQQAAMLPVAADPGSQLRIKAAWLYYIEGLTQSDVAERLGVNRVMIVRLLAEARRRGEVSIRIRSKLTGTIEAEVALEKRFGLSKAIVAPFQDETGDPTAVIAAAAGDYVTGIMRHGITVGVGWGRTLHASLPHLEGRSLENARVISLLGGIAEARRFNPAEFAWRFAEVFDAEGFLIPAPAIVDSTQTKTALLERCGLEQIMSMADDCDVVLFSCGGISSITTSYRLGPISEGERRSLVKAGAVGDVLFNFIDREGRIVDHPANAMSISISIDRLARLPEKVLISGGPEKTDVMFAALRSLKPSVLVTDERTASRLLSESTPDDGNC